MLVLLLLVAVVRYAQRTENNKFSISKQYFKKEVESEFDFLHADKHQVDTIIQVDTTFLQLDTINIGADCNLCMPKTLKIRSMHIFWVFQERRE